MKYVKYISFSLLFFLIGVVGVKANSPLDSELICKYTFDCSQIVDELGLHVSDEYKTEVLIYKSKEGDYTFNIEGNDYVPTVHENGYVETTEFPAFCGYHSSGQQFEPTLMFNEYAKYFFENKPTKETCPDMHLFRKVDQWDAITNQLYAVGDIEATKKITKVTNYLTLKPDSIKTDKELEESGGFRCHYRCDNFLLTNKFDHIIEFSDGKFNVTGVYGMHMLDGYEFADFSSELKSAKDCPYVIYINGYGDFEKEGPKYHKSLYFSKEKDELSARCINYNYTPDYDINNDGLNLSGCIIDPGTRETIDWIMNLVRVGGIILLIVLGMLDFIKAAASGEQDEMKKSSGKFVKRLIACVALFLAPIFVDLILSLVNITGGADEDCNSSPKPEVTEKKECWELGASDCANRTDCSWTNNTCKSACNILSIEDCTKRSDCMLGETSGSSMPVCKQIITDVVDCTKLDSSSCKQHSHCKFSNNTCNTACDYLSLSECNKRNDCKWGASSGSSTGSCKAK